MRTESVNELSEDGPFRRRSSVPPAECARVIRDDLADETVRSRVAIRRRSLRVISDYQDRKRSDDEPRCDAMTAPPIVLIGVRQGSGGSEQCFRHERTKAVGA